MLVNKIIKKLVHVSSGPLIILKDTTFDFNNALVNALVN